MSAPVRVELGERSYDVHVGSSTLARASRKAGIEPSRLADHSTLNPDEN